MKKLFTILAVSLCSILAMAQTSQYFWYNGNLIMGNPINQVDSITFGNRSDMDSIVLYLPRTQIIHDTIYVDKNANQGDKTDTSHVINANVGFSVSANKRIKFASGNLQYMPSTQTWRFAEHQYDYIGDNNSLVSATYNGWIDLFGWGTGSTPVNTNATLSTFVDWGNNVINYAPQGIWRAITHEEWYYLLAERNQAKAKYSSATVNGIHGLILLPDNWTLPNGVSFKARALTWSENTYTITQWNKLENAGAVFLPAAGYRYYTTVSNVQTNGYYWTSTTNGTAYAYAIRFNYYSAEADYSYYKFNGYAVRLVQDIQ